MYTLEELKQKSLKELKEIGWQLNVLPEGDRRCRINWINALAGVQPPLLQLLETSPGVEVEPVEEAIKQSTNSRRVVVASEPIGSDYRGEGYAVDHDEWEDEAVNQCAKNYCYDSDYAGLNDVEVEQVQEPIEFSLGGGRFQEPDGRRYVYRGHRRFYIIEATMEEAVDMNSYGEPVYPEWPDGWLPDPEKSLNVEPKSATKPIAPAAENSINAGVDRAQYPNITLQAAFNDEQPPNRGDNGRDRLESEARLSQSAIGLAAKNFLDADQNPLTGIALSDRFLVRYSPPQSENIYYQTDTDGQLSLLDFEIETADEPPDPDDFELLEDFRKAITRWDLEHYRNFH